MCLEGYSFGNRQQRGNHDRAEATGIVKHYLLSQGYTIYVVPPTNLKSLIAGHGHASKSSMKKTVEDLTGLSPSDDNEADAIALVLYLEQILFEEADLNYRILPPYWGLPNVTSAAK